ncbi:ATPase [bacterium SM23_57]|nr:MAG: ATPase [bacterium SM23_57]
MKIAIPVANGKLCAHFGHCEYFALISVDPSQNQILSNEMAVPPAHEPGALPKWLSENSVNVIIAGGMGMRAQQFFAQYGIEVVIGAQPDIPENVVLEYLDGELNTGANPCDH